MLRYRIEGLYVPETALRAIRGHRRIVDCIRRKNYEGIELAIREHWEQSKRDIQRYAFEEKQAKQTAYRSEQKTLPTSFYDFTLREMDAFLRDRKRVVSFSCFSGESGFSSWSGVQYNSILKVSRSMECPGKRRPVK